MIYQKMAIPPRSEHLWRYTPWPRIHPSSIDKVPDVDGVIFSLSEQHEMESVAHSTVAHDDIARAFLQSAGGSHNRLVVSEESEPIHIVARASGHIAVGHLHLDVKASGVVLIHLTGEP